MNILEIIKEAFISLKANKLRSFLTILGIVVGLFSIIAVSSIVEILQKSISEGLSILSKNTFQIQRTPAIKFGRLSEKIRNRPKITLEEFYRFKELMTNAQYVAAEVMRWGEKVKREKYETNPNISIIGVTPESFFTNDIVVEFGRMINENDVDYSISVCVIGPDVKDKLFPNEDAVGKFIDIKNLRFQVVGVSERRGQIFGQSQDNFVTIPITVFHKLYGAEFGSIAITVMAYGSETYEETINEAIGHMRTVRKIQPGEENNFEIFSNSSLIEQVSSITKYVEYGSIAIAMIALLAAGVGIMNIMLVSVTERTKEIGIRKAIGATKRDILKQFLLEAIVLSLIGGSIGIILGILVGNLIGSMIAKVFAIPIFWTIVGVILCVFVGIVFGVYPAYKAANLDPIEALRYE